MTTGVSGLEAQNSTFQPVRAGSNQPIRLAMQRLWLTGKVVPAGAHLFIQHQFRNGETEPIEAVYTFALPRDAALRRFVLQGEHFRAESELHPVKEARERYEAGMAAGSLSALLEQHGDSLMGLSLGNLRPGESVTVTMEMLAGVESHDDRVRFRFPFTLAPSYHREARAIECPDGAGEIELPSERFGDLILPRWFRDASVLHAVGFSLDVSAAESAAGVSSPSHEIRVTASEGKQVASLRASSDVPDRDLVLDLPLAENSPQAWVGSLTDAPSPARRQWVAKVPSSFFGEPVDAPHRIAFVIDCSGSMYGLPLDQAKVALKASLGCLQPGDSFALIAFGSGYTSYGEALRPANAEEIRQARQWVEDLDTMGGTELVPPLEHTVRLLGGSGSILLMTDGQVFGQEAILDLVEGSGIAVHSLGIGEASQDAFLASLSARTHATSRFVSARERVDREAMELFAETRERIATDLEVAAEGTVHHVASKQIFARRPAMIFGEGAVDANVPLALRWNSASGEPQSKEIVIPATESNETAALLVGAKRIAALNARMPGADRAGEREGKRIESALATLSQEYGLASRSMALVAVHKREDDVAGSVPKTVVVAVGTPRDQQFGAIFPPPPAAARPGMFARTFSDGPMLACAAMEVPTAPSINARKHEEHGAAAGRRFAGFPSGIPSGPARRLRASGLAGRRVGDDSSRPRRPGVSQDQDSLAELAAQFEPDGGLPAANLEDRVRRTLSALLRFVADGSTTKRGPYRQIVHRGLEFLNLHAAAAGKHEETVREATRRVESGQTEGVLSQLQGISTDAKGMPWKVIEKLLSLA